MACHQCSRQACSTDAFIDMRCQCSRRGKQRQYQPESHNAARHRTAQCKATSPSIHRKPTWAPSLVTRQVPDHGLQPYLSRSSLKRTGLSRDGSATAFSLRSVQLAPDLPKPIPRHHDAVGHSVNWHVDATRSQCNPPFANFQVQGLGKRLPK